ncbi:MAG TPA: ferredoxin family protein [Pyrinomonadaceae bacterium]|nr:ferredoxin family protein [Pyrinomonadaceae bacterium]
MTYIVVELCVDCKYTDCAAVCPVEAFHELPDRLYINPQTCIDCDACVPECPVEAIFSEATLPEQYADWLEMNAEAEQYPIISMKKEALFGPGCTGPQPT